MAIARFLARLQVRRTEHGGRHSAIWSGYRGLLNFELGQSPCFNDGQVTFIGRAWCAPGESCDAEVVLLCPECVPVEIKPGVQFQLNEGRRPVADGEVLATKVENAADHPRVS